MPNLGTPLYPIRLSDNDKAALDNLAQHIGTENKADTIRYLIRQATRNLEDQIKERNTRRSTSSIQAV